MKNLSVRKLLAGKFLAAVMIGALAASFAFDAEAQRRMGGGRNIGKQSAPVQQQTDHWRDTDRCATHADR